MYFIGFEKNQIPPLGVKMNEKCDIGYTSYILMITQYTLQITYQNILYYITVCGFYKCVIIGGF